MNKEISPGNDNVKSKDKNYWDSRWQAHTTGWDLGTVSPPIKEYIDQLRDKNIAILIPGCGNAYEGEYLLEKGFTNITLIDISPTASGILQNKFKDHSQIKILCEDFFQHKGKYDLVIEQTFFCAIPPTRRMEYVAVMNKLLNEKGKIAGVLFDRDFESEGPPFGGRKEQYEEMFNPYFKSVKFETCYNSHPAREGQELFINLIKL